MGQLIRKDLRLMLKWQVWSMVLLLFFMLPLNLFQSTVFFGVLSAVYFVLYFPDFERRNNSHILWAGLAVTRKDFVNTKYVEGLAFSIIGPLLAYLLQFIRMFVDAPVFPFYPDMLIGMGIAVFMIAVFYPLVLLTTEAIPFYVAYIVIFVVTNPLIYLVYQARKHGGDITFGLILFVCVIGYALSYLLSVKIYQEKDIH